MSVILDDCKLFYAAVPKVACTSIKMMFFAIENDRPFLPFVINGRVRHIHNIGYKSLLREYYPEARIADYHRITLVRDPVKRFLSAYSNRVLHHRELSWKLAGKKLKELGLTATPDLDLFIDRYEAYLQAHPSILHHTRPMVDFLGEDPSYFARVYRFDEIPRFVEDVSERVGKPVEIGHEQTGGPKFSPSDLTEAQLRKVKDIYRRDYEVFGEYF